jgi:hypothetical protein
MVNPNGGALAVWASSSLTVTPDQTPMNLAFYAKLFGTPTATLGEAAAYAKSASNSPDVRRTWILFGDPSLKLH